LSHDKRLAVVLLQDAADQVDVEVVHEHLKRGSAQLLKLETLFQFELFLKTLDENNA
jgi:hypothetical protein